MLQGLAWRLPSCRTKHRTMSRDQQELWAAAAAACKSLAATLGTGEAAVLDAATILVDSLSELGGQQDSEPTADFLRRAAHSVP